VKKAGFSDEDATALLERAFGWRTQTFWRGLKKEEVPVAESVAATLGFLRDLGALLPLQFAFLRWAGKTGGATGGVGVGGARPP